MRSMTNEHEADYKLLHLTPQLVIEIAMWGESPPAPQIILLHEGLGSVKGWGDFPQRLSRETGCGVIAYSREGYGQSSPLRSLDNMDYLHEEARRMALVLDALNIEKAYLFGHSDGGSIAIIAAAMLPQRVVSIFVEAPHLYVEPETVKAVKAAGKAWDEGILKKSLQRQHANAEPVFKRWYNLWTGGNFFHHFNLLPELKNVSCNIVAVQGSKDEFASPRQLQDIETLAQRARALWIKECGHAPHRQNPDLIVSLVKDWLRQ